MELADGERHPPAARRPAKGGVERAAEDEQARGVEAPEGGAHDELRAREAEQGDERLARGREDDGADKGARDGAGKGEVVVGGPQGGAGALADGRAVEEDVVRGLQVKRLLDLCVRRDEEVRERHGKEERVERQVCASQRLPGCC